MKHNKNYFMLYSNAGVNDGDYINYNNLSLRYILGQLYDKYNAFSLKLEQFICRSANTTVITDDFLLLHIEGLPFMNGYDTSPNYRNSRVLEVIDYAALGNIGYSFISNNNVCNFWKPSIENVNLKLFHTRINDETKIHNNDAFTMIFSIIGIEEYQTKKPIKDIIDIPRFQGIKTINFSLSTYKAESIDARNRAFKFSGVNLRSLIGSDYDRYKKFALITKSYAYSEFSGGSYPQSFSGFYVGNIFMSGFDWFRPSKPQNDVLGTTAQQVEIAYIHQTPPCVISQISYGGGSLVSKVFKEVYIENVFEKSQDIIDIIISNIQIYSYALTPFNATNNILFPHFTFNFDIIPLDEY